ncbi:hypothetical protein YPPY48_3666, partial [Yersinia pestis PY-48]
MNFCSSGSSPSQWQCYDGATANSQNNMAG